MSQARSHAMRALTGASLLVSLLVMGGCSLWGGTPKPKPAELGPNVPVLGVRQAWVSQIGAQEGLELDMHVEGSLVTVASANGDSLKTGLLFGSMFALVLLACIVAARKTVVGEREPLH